MHSQRLAVCMIRGGNEVAVITLCPKTGQKGRWTRDPLGVPLRLVRNLGEGRARDLYFALATMWLLLTCCRRYDAIHWTMTGLHATLGLPLAHWLGIRNVVMFAASGDLPRLRQSLPGLFFLWGMRRWVRRIIVLNQQMMEEVQQAGLPASRAVIFPCEIDSDVYTPPDPDLKADLRRELRFASDDAIIIFVGRFVLEKCLPQLVAAFAQTRRDWSNAQLVLVGDGPLMPGVRKQIAELGLESYIRLPGFLDSESVRDYLQAADIFALVSSSEGIPCALIEAMAVGLPSVVTAIPAMTQVVDNEVHGLRIEPGHPELIAAALNQLLRDPDRRVSMGLRARDLVRARYTMNVMAWRYDAFFRELREERA